MWAITSYFNPVGFKRRLSNYKIFRTNLAVPLVTVELSFNGCFELTDEDADVLIQISGGAVLWQKERLLNLAVEAVPSNVESIAWLDCDVMLERADWVDEAKRQLSKFNVIQLFSVAEFIDSKDYKKLPDRCSGDASVPGIASLSNAGELLSLGRQEHYRTRAALSKEVLFHPGLAWAAKRKLLEEHGFYDASILGGGDELMAAAMYGQCEGLMKKFLLDGARQQHYLKWAIPYNKSVAGCVGHVSGTIFHLAHGERKNRAYRVRQERLASFGFNPGTDLEVGANGAWHWARPRPNLEDFLRQYFMSRAEDE